MKIIVTGSLGHISKPLTEILLQKGHEVTVISSKAERKADINALGAAAAIGSVADKDFLTKTFAGADLVYTMLPPGNFMDQDYDLTGNMANVMHNYQHAISNNGIKLVVHLSSVGAHTDKGNGLLRFHYIAESILKELPPEVHLTFMRPTGFYYNLFAFTEMIRNMGVIATNYGQGDVAVWVAPEDIAVAIAEEIEKPSAVTPSVRYVASDELACSETAAILGKAIGKPELQWIIISDEQMLNGLVSRGMKPDIAAGMVEMYSSNHQGILYQDYFRNRPAVMGKIKMADFAKDFAVAFNQK